MDQAISSISVVRDYINWIIETLEDLEKTGTLEELVTAYHYANLWYKDLDEQRKRLYKALDHMNKGVLPEKFADRDLDKIQLKSLSRSFYPITKLSASFHDKERGFEWLRENGDDALITETVNAGTLASHVKRMIEDEGIDPPEDIVKVNTYKITGSSKYTPK